MFTATESAAVAVIWAFFVTMFIYRDYKWSELPKMLHRTMRTLSIVMILIAFGMLIYFYRQGWIFPSLHKGPPRHKIENGSSAQQECKR